MSHDNDRPGYTEKIGRQVVENAKQGIGLLGLRNVVHALVLEEVPMELDSVVRENIQSHIDYFDDQPRTEMSYSRYHEIVCEIDIFPNKLNVMDRIQAESEFRRST